MKFKLGVIVHTAFFIFLGSVLPVWASGVNKSSSAKDSATIIELFPQPKATFLSQITDLSWVRLELIYDEDNIANTQPLPLVLHIIGRFSDLHSNIIYKNQPIRISPDATFSIREFVDRKTMHFDFTAIRQNGTLQSETMSIVVPDAQWQQALKWKYDSVTKRLNFGISLAWTYLTYSEDYLNTQLSELALSGRIYGQYSLFPNHLVLSLNTYINIVPFQLNGTSDVSTNLSVCRFFGASALANYQLPVHLGATLFVLGAGWHVWGMLVSPATYGISFLQGPQVLLSATTNIFHRATSIYVKFAPILDQFGQISFSSREYSSGIKHSLTRFDANREWTLVLDISDLRTFSAPQNNGAHLSAISLGVQTNLGSRK
jgi:hypothetical protein